MKLRIIFPFLFFCSASFAQSLTIQSGSSIVLSSGTTFSVDGLVLTPSSDFTLAGPLTLTRATTVTHPTPDSYVSRVYLFSNTLPSFSGNITVYYQDAELNGLAENTLTLSVYNGSNWTDYNSGVSRDANANYVSTSGITNASLNELILASPTVILPVQWLSVNARTQGTSNVISWVTTNEVQVKGYQVQRSVDARSWINLGGTIPATNAAGDHRYFLSDTNPFEVVTYYRILESDNDGHSRFSNVVLVSNSATGTFSIFPNPAASFVSFRSSGIIGPVEIFNAAGERVLQTIVNQNSGVISVAQWPVGLYFIRVGQSGAIKTLSFIKK